MGGAEVLPGDFLVDGLEVEEEARDEVRGQATLTRSHSTIRSVRTQPCRWCSWYARLCEQGDEADSLQGHPGDLYLYL